MTWLIEEWMALGGGAKNSPGHGFSLEGGCVLFSVSARRPQGAHGHAGKFLYTQWPPHAPLWGGVTQQASTVHHSFQTSGLQTNEVSFDVKMAPLINS